MAGEVIIETQEREVDCEKTNISNPRRKFTSIFLGHAQAKDADHFALIFVILLVFSSYIFSQVFQKYNAFPQFIRDFPEMMILFFMAMVSAGFVSCHYAVRNKTLTYLYLSVSAFIAGFSCTMLISSYFCNFDPNSLPGMLLFCGIGYYTYRTNTLKVLFITLVAWEIILISSLAFAIYVDYDWSHWGLTLIIVFVIWCLLGLLFCFPSFVTSQRRVLHDMIGCLILPLNMMYNCQIAERANQQLTYEDKEQFFYGVATTCVFVESAVLFLILLQIVNRCQEDAERKMLE